MPILSAEGIYKIEHPEECEGQNPSTSLRVLNFATPSVGKIGNVAGNTRQEQS